MESRGRGRSSSAPCWIWGISTVPRTSTRMFDRGTPVELRVAVIAVYWLCGRLSKPAEAQPQREAQSWGRKGAAWMDSLLC